MVPGKEELSLQSASDAEQTIAPQTALSASPVSYWPSYMDGLFAEPGSDTVSDDGDLKLCMDLFCEESRQCQVEGGNDASRFTLQYLVGVGGFGIVLCVHDGTIDRKVAMKMLKPSLRTSPSLVRRFFREIEVAESLHHSGILRVLETGQISGHPYILSELVDGPNLSQYLKSSGGKLQQRHAAQLIADVATTLQFAHEHGVLHRDLKPANLLMAPVSDKAAGAVSYEPRLTDFGLAKKIDELADPQDNLSCTVQVMGTPRYMSPEQASGNVRDVGISSDIYSLGAILHQCLTGQTPFSAGTHAELLLKIQSGTVSSLRKHDGTISRDLENIVLKCLSRAPKDRYRTAEDLAADLQRFLRNEPVQARRASLWRRSRHWARTNPITAILSMGFATAVGTSIALLGQMYVSAKHEAAMKDRMLDVVIRAVNHAYTSVAEKMLVSVPNTLEQQYELHRLGLEAHKKIAADFGHDSRSRYRLSVQYSYLGRAAQRIQRFEEADELLETCIAILQDLLRKEPDNADYQYDIFFNRKVIADGTRTVEARIPALTQALQEISELVQLKPDNLDYLDAKASVLFSIGTLQQQLVDPQCVSNLMAAAEISDKLVTKCPQKHLYAKYAVLARTALIQWYVNAGELDKAGILCSQSRTYQNILVPDGSPDFAMRRILYSVLRINADVLMRLKEWDTGVAATEEALMLGHELLHENPDETSLIVDRCELLYWILEAHLQAGLSLSDLNDLMVQIDDATTAWKATGIETDRISGFIAKVNALKPLTD